MKKFLGCLAFLGLSILGFGFGQESHAAVIHRLYQPYSGEHLYTSSGLECDALVNAGWWQYENVAWNSSDNPAIPVYRVSNPNTGDHHYTTALAEKNMLVANDWNDEGIAFYSAESTGVPVYRLYNPNAKGAGSHHYTLSDGERGQLVASGWRDEGISWYVESSGNSADAWVNTHINDHNRSGRWMNPTGGVQPNLALYPNLSVEVSLAQQVITIKSGQDAIYRMVCSTGLNNWTPRGVFAIQNRGLSFASANYWVSYIGWGQYLFHTVLIDGRGNYIPADAEKLGSPASHGCIRLSVADAKWFYNQIPQNTRVTIY